MNKITVYELSHWNKTENDVIEKLAGDGKLLGFFSSRKKCKDIQKFYNRLPGFSQKPDGYEIRRWMVKDAEDQLDHVFFLEHEYSDERFDYYTKIGVYALESSAEFMRDQLISKKNSKYKGKVDGFTISKCILDHCEWSEGYNDFSD